MVMYETIQSPDRPELFAVARNAAGVRTVEVDGFWSRRTADKYAHSLNDAVQIEAENLKRANEKRSRVS